MFGNPRVKATRRGTWKLKFTDVEIGILRSLGPQLRTLLIHGPDDPDLRRLFPTAYPDDPDADAFYQLLAKDDLLARRLANLDTFEACLGSDTLTTDELTAFMGAVNDLRLVLGTKLDVSEEDDLTAMADDDPNAPAMALYAFLGFVLECVVDALFGTVPERGTESS
ncbi:MAG: DUF2017 family protein [Acidimicrobiia bacterium]